jgi:uncharacterized membrane protein YkoI
MRAMKMLLPVKLVALALCLGAQLPALAKDIGHEEATSLAKEGRILPLAEIMKKVGVEAPGEVIEVELELEHGAYVYELKILSPDGRRQDFEVDAATGDILDAEDED